MSTQSLRLSELPLFHLLTETLFNLTVTLLDAADVVAENQRAGCLPYRASVPSSPHAMLPAESILFLFDRFEHKWRRVHWLLDGGQLAVFLEVNTTVCAEQNVLPAPVVPVLGG